MTSPDYVIIDNLAKHILCHIMINKPVMCASLTSSSCPVPTEEFLKLLPYD
ncbi:hypothetical protein VCSRO192_2022 [Vibrio cholerae]|nr:hypothetical protein VCSRO192_2022 [Vibrio cholerae]